MYKNRPIVIKDFFEQDIHQTIVEYLDAIVPLLPKNQDSDLFNRRFIHNSPFFCSIHSQLTDSATRIFGEKVKPSYNFLSMYDKNGSCPLHIDRKQCRYTIDYLIRTTSDKSWPIKIGPQMADHEIEDIESFYPDEDQQKLLIQTVEWSEIELNPNDAVCYSGTNAWHYRPTESEGRTDLVFFHFVPEAFNGPLD